MKTKLVTMYYAYHGGPPFWAQNNRDSWYKSSLISICKLGVDIVCYTDKGDRGENQLLEIKEKHKLDNLTVKVYELIENPYQNRIYQIRMSNPTLYDNPERGHFYCGSPQVYWSKFDFLLKEHESNIKLYWIDCGLSHPGMFPLNGRQYSYEEDYKHYEYPDHFNESTIEKINAYSENKIVNLYQSYVSNQNIREFNEVIGFDSDYDGIYVKGGFFGGNSNLMLPYLEELKKTIDLFLEKKKAICMEEQIMIYVNFKHRDWFKNWKFDTWYPDIPNEIGFHEFFLQKNNKKN